ncbi:MAG TPA: hypothetical protein VMW80_07540 [Candidatus Dormibacteraeota bacterium]|nr:hypothetical protein [Candidatus Dormibacteraeota bacterium]
MIDLVPVAKPQASLGPGKPLRFAVFADDGRRSIGWTLWTSRHTRDAYLTPRPLGGTWKISLHQSGRWHSGLTQELVAKAPLPIASRHLDTWQMPDELGEGVRRSVELVFPDSELRLWPPGVSEPKPVVRVPAPGANHAACIELIFMPGAPPMLLVVDAAFDVAELTLSDGNMLRVVARQIPWPATDVEWLLASKGDLLAKVDPQVRLNAPNPRGMLYGKHDNGIRYAVDGALDSEPSATQG